MSIKPNYVVIAISVLVVVMVAVGLIARNAGTGSPVPTKDSKSTSTVQQPKSGLGDIPSPRAQKPSTPSQVAPVQTSKISILSPVTSDKWVVGQNNVIRWSKEAQIPGSIYLVHAVTDKTVPVGWIISEIGPHQTSYTWDTRDLFVSRYNAAKRNLETGDYIMKIKFDSKVMPEVSSAPFSIIYASEVVIPVYDIRIKDFTFNPPTLTLKKGDKIKFTNDDAVDQRVVLSTVSPFVIKPGQSLVFDTSFFSSGGMYTFYSDVYSSLVLKITVR